MARYILAIVIGCLAMSVMAHEETDSISGAQRASRELLIEKAESGDIESMNYLGYLLLGGDGEEERDIPAGIKWLTLAANAGDAKAASNLGWLLIDGSIVERNLPEGIKWLDTAAAKGLPVAQALLGDLYRDGIGVEKNEQLADSLFRTAFEGGLTDAGYKLFDLNKDKYEALTAAEKVKEGKYYYLRYAPSMGVRLFYMAAEEDNADAMALLGDAYTRALGVPYDYNLSLNYYARAAQAGNPSAQFIIGELLEIFPDALDNLDPSYFAAPLSDDPAFWFDAAAAAGVTDADIAMRRLLD